MKLFLIVCNQQDLITWINARLAVDGTHMSTIYVAPDPRGRSVWLWVAADAEMLKWKNTEAFGEFLQIVGASSDGESLDEWEPDESDADAEVNLSGEHM